MRHAGLIAVFMVAFGVQAQAGLVGSTLNVQHLFGGGGDPTTTATSSLGALEVNQQVSVTNALELSTFHVYFDVDIQDNQISFRLPGTALGGFGFFSSGLNGIRFIDLTDTAEAFTSVSFASTPVGSLYFDANAIFVNFAGVTTFGETVTLNVDPPTANPGTSEVPEPGTVALLGAGIAGLAIARRFKNR